MNPDYWLKAETIGDAWYYPVYRQSEREARFTAVKRLNDAAAPTWTVARLLTPEGQEICRWDRAPVAV